MTGIGGVGRGGWGRVRRGGVRLGGVGVVTATLVPVPSLWGCLFVFGFGCSRVGRCCRLF